MKVAVPCEIFYQIVYSMFNLGRIIVYLQSIAKVDMRERIEKLYMPSYTFTNRIYFIWKGVEGRQHVKTGCGGVGETQTTSTWTPRFRIPLADPATETVSCPATLWYNKFWV